ncbi:hypothetical protein EP47_00320 [Legionella norrlandica]|uniref:Coiled-coil protein n=1 Tax=Legionella norrlandica TaxID=1498499 RepID=A0A0A2SUA6_9GAMM|nr:hypothetical protein [Legionella norrlandica]KGP64327.1 hypothetical protein EP47_00320 [Legionella norrlandica]
MGLGKKIELSQRSQELLNDYLNLNNSESSSVQNITSPIDFSVLIQLLTREFSKPPKVPKEIKKKREFILAAMRAELLRDLNASLNTTISQEAKPVEQETPWYNKLKFWFLAMAGTLVAACEGFDSISTMMVALSFPAWLVLAGGILFSILSVVVFYGFDLVQVSQNVGIKLTDAPKLLDIYLLQMEEIKAIRRKISGNSFALMSTEELDELKRTVSMLQIHVKSLIKTSKQFDEALNSRKMNISKAVISGISGVLFFGGGFFAGQSVALYLFALFMTSVTPAFWPVILFSVVVGLAAFSLYWYVQRVGVNKLVSEWFGLDEDKIEKLCGKSNLDKELKKLDNLQEKIMTTSNLISEVTHLKGKLTKLEEQIVNIPSDEVSDASKEKSLKTSSNIYSFHFNSANQTSHSCEQTLDAASGYGMN